MKKQHSFKIGDAVAYSVQFLRSIGCSHSGMARGRGVITELKDYGITLAKINWTVGAEDCAELVNVGNLAKVGPNSRFCNVG